MEEAAVVRSIWIDAQQSKVWRAVTDPEMLEQWYAPGSPWEISELQPGAAVFFHLKPSPHNQLSDTLTIEGRIEAAEEPARLSIRWQTEPTVETLITFLLSEEIGGTRVRIIEGRYVSLPGSDTEEGEGFMMSLENLKALVEGRRLPH